MTIATALVRTVIGGSISVAIFLLGRASHRPAHEGTDTPVCVADRPLNQAKGIALLRVLRDLPAPAARSAPGEGSHDDAAAVAEARLARADFLLEEVFRQLGQPRLGAMEAETRAVAALPFLSGMLKGAIQADPGIRTAFSQQFTRALCERELADDQAISVAHMATILPDIATTQGMDCFFSKAKEGAPFWAMLDAWRRSGLEKTRVLDRIQASATDPRTTRRFLSKEEAMAQRISTAASIATTSNERTTAP